jgi:hypothetical protein
LSDSESAIVASPVSVKRSSPSAFLDMQTAGHIMKLRLKKTQENPNVSGR